MSRKTLRWIAWLLLVLVPVLAASLVAQSPEAWRLELGTRVTCGIAVASDGLLYAGCADGVLYTVGPEGALGWSFATGGAIGGVAVTSGQKLILVGSTDHSLYALDPTGGLQWSFEASDEIRSAPSLATDGTIVLGCDGGYLYALHPDGSLNWTFDAAEEICSAPTVLDDGTILFGTEQGGLWAVDPAGSLLWRLEIGYELSAELAESGGILYVTGEDVSLQAITTAGDLLWSFEAPHMIGGAPAAGLDGSVYFGCWDHHLYAIGPSGDLVWTFPTDGRVRSTPVVDGEGRIYFGSDDGYVYVLDPGGVLMGRYAAASPVRARTALLDGRLLVAASEDGVVHGWLLDDSAAPAAVTGDESEELASYCRDDDGDGWGDAADCRELASAGFPYTAVQIGDCDDDNPSVHPGAAESCDGVDNDCDGQIDEEDAAGCERYYRDLDGDTWGIGASKCLCSPSASYSATRRDDCDDANPLVNPGAAEVCDGVDNDCDGQIDEEDATGCTTYYYDYDGDAYGDAAVSGKCLCGPSYPTLYTATQWNDCDDSHPLVNPGAAEACDGVDNDCDGQIDEEDATGCTTYYYDYDGDAYGDAAVSGKCLCGPSYPTLYTATQWNDCDDSHPLVNPGAAEACDGVDNDCDGQIDEEDATGCTTYYYDYDGDAYGDAAVSGKCLCGPSYPTLYTATQWNDCDDANPLVNPGMSPESDCTDGKDNDCDGLTDGDDPDCGSP